MHALISPSFDPWSALAGGALIGLSASLMMLLTGRVAGISGIIGGLLGAGRQDVAWRVAFVVGLLGAGVVAMRLDPSLLAASDQRTLLATGIAGVCVGFGVRLGSGCTSGHGVCGLSRFSQRSLVATLTFMATGIATATAIQLFRGGLV